MRIKKGKDDVEQKEDKAADDGEIGEEEKQMKVEKMKKEKMKKGKTFALFFDVLLC